MIDTLNDPAADPPHIAPGQSGNADPAELAKFSALAHRWWDPQSEFKPLHDINPLRLRWIDELAAGLSGRRVADIGCGGGILAESMAQRGARVTGADLSSKAIAVAKLHQFESGSNVEYRHEGAESLAREMPCAFDVVACLELLEHVPEPASTIAACATLAKPGGLVVFSTLNRNAKSYVQAIIGAEYLLRLLPRGTHDWSRFLRPSELAAHARRVDLRLERMIGMTYNPLTRTYRLIDDTSVNYMAGFRRGEPDGR
ncbi:MAG: bifunctional 2-polyprenyl-6-hydroxyphenol methylase/3-demethylubiquinol 3-O-methyltransferase UbiG [Betaproteobacteria bacterium]